MLENVPLQTFIDELSFSFNRLQLIVSLATASLFQLSYAGTESDRFDFVEFACNQSPFLCSRAQRGTAHLIA